MDHTIPAAVYINLGKLPTTASEQYSRVLRIIHRITIECQIHRKLLKQLKHHINMSSTGRRNEQEHEITGPLLGKAYSRQQQCRLVAPRSTDQLWSHLVCRFWQQWKSMANTELWIITDSTKKRHLDGRGMVTYVRRRTLTSGMAKLECESTLTWTWPYWKSKTSNQCVSCSICLRVPILFCLLPTQGELCCVLKKKNAIFSLAWYLAGDRQISDKRDYAPSQASHSKSR